MHCIVQMGGWLQLPARHGEEISVNVYVTLTRVPDVLIHSCIVLYVAIFIVLSIHQPRILLQLAISTDLLCPVTYTLHTTNLAALFVISTHEHHALRFNDTSVVET